MLLLLQLTAAVALGNLLSAAVVFGVNTYQARRARRDHLRRLAELQKALETTAAEKCDCAGCKARRGTLGANLQAGVH